jgi:V8-like Glu-specific endopeptidase
MRLISIKIIIPEWDIPTVNKDGELREPELYEGDRENINLHTGEITGVGTNHLEYNINTCDAVSGAPVICVDKRPEFEPYRRKVIAIHAGAPQGIDMNTKMEFNFNIGFKTRCRHE